MSLAFEVTDLDVYQAALIRGVVLDDEAVTRAYEALDMDQIEAAALSEDDITDQTFAAHLEIVDQLETLGFVGPSLDPGPLDNGNQDPV